eukprot:6175791-Pleurochrysis_carterae.AAC.3
MKGCTPVHTTQQQKLSRCYITKKWGKRGVHSACALYCCLRGDGVEVFDIVGRDGPVTVAQARHRREAKVERANVHGRDGNDGGRLARPNACLTRLAKLRPVLTHPRRFKRGVPPLARDKPCRRSPILWASSAAFTNAISRFSPCVVHVCQCTARKRRGAGLGVICGDGAEVPPEREESAAHEVSDEEPEDEDEDDAEHVAAREAIPPSQQARDAQQPRRLD